MAIKRDFGFLQDMRDMGGDMFLDLKFKNQVNTFAHELFGIPDGDIRIVAIIKVQQLNAGRGCGGSHA